MSAEGFATIKIGAWITAAGFGIFFGAPIVAGLGGDIIDFFGGANADGLREDILVSAPFIAILVGLFGIGVMAAGLMGTHTDD